jgi:hypothetical protein
MNRWTAAGRTVVLVLCTGTSDAGPRLQATNPVAAVLEQFQERVKDYIKLRDQVQATLPPLRTTDNPAVIRGRQQALARAVREARPNVRAGDVFIADAAPVFRRVIAADFSRRTAEQRRAALKEVPGVRLRPNDEYPLDQPLATVPPRLLAQLPRLPDGLEFRFAGNALILCDVNANLVVDVLDGAIPRQ